MVSLKDNGIFAFTRMLLGKDRRSIGRVQEAIDVVHDQHSFDQLMQLLFHHERLLVMRAADAVEKITRKHPEMLQPHKLQLLNLLNGAMDIELKWHLAVLVTRLELNAEELNHVWSLLVHWALNPHESKLVRVHALQGLHDLVVKFPAYRQSYNDVREQLSHVPVPSIKSRLKKLMLG